VNRLGKTQGEEEEIEEEEGGWGKKKKNSPSLCIHIKLGILRTMEDLEPSLEMFRSLEVRILNRFS